MILTFLGLNLTLLQCNYCPIFKKSSVCQIMVKNSNFFSIDLVIYSSIFWWAARLFISSLLILEQAAAAHHGEQAGTWKIGLLAK